MNCPIRLVERFSIKKFTYTIFILMIFLSSKIDNWGEEDGYCATAESRRKNNIISGPKNIIKKIMHQMKHDDVDYLVGYLEESLSENKMKITELGFKRKDILKWRRTGRISGFKKIEREIESVSFYKRPTAYMIKKYMERARQLRISKSKIDKEINKYVKKGEGRYFETKKSCTTKDHRGEALGPNRKQGKLAWCFGYTAADLISHKIGKRVSALDVLMSYYDKKWQLLNLNDWTRQITKLKQYNRKLYEKTGGYLDLAVTVALQKGICLEKDLPTDKLKSGELYDLLKILEDREFENEDYSYASINCLLKEIFPNVDNNLKNFIKEIPKDMYKYLYDLREKSCQKRESFKFKVKTEKAYTKHAKRELINSIDERLSSGNIVGIRYHEEILKNQDQEDFDSRHASSVVARRFNESSGECEYLVRNSYGEGCSTYDGNYSCENGNIWLKKTILSRSLEEIFYLE